MNLVIRKNLFPEFARASDIDVLLPDSWSAAFRQLPDTPPLSVELASGAYLKEQPKPKK